MQIRKKNMKILDKKLRRRVNRTKRNRLKHQMEECGDDFGCMIDLIVKGESLVDGKGKYVYKVRATSCR